MGLPVWIGLYLGYRWTQGTRFVPLLECDFHTGNVGTRGGEDDDDEDDEDDEGADGEFREVGRLFGFALSRNGNGKMKLGR